MTDTARHIQNLNAKTGVYAAEELVDAVDPDGDLEDVREDVETLYRKLARGEGAAPVSGLRALPSLGKTTSAIKTAADIPTTYRGIYNGCLNSRVRVSMFETVITPVESWGNSCHHALLCEELTICVPSRRCRATGISTRDSPPFR